MRKEVKDNLITFIEASSEEVKRLSTVNYCDKHVRDSTREILSNMYTAVEILSMLSDDEIKPMTTAHG